MSAHDFPQPGKETRPADSSSKAHLAATIPEDASMPVTESATCVLDASVFPYLVDLVATYSPFETQLTLRLTCRHIRDLIDEQMPNHMLVVSGRRRVVKIDGEWADAPFLPHLIRFADCRWQHYKPAPPLTIPNSPGYDNVEIVLENKPDDTRFVDTRVICPTGTGRWSLPLWTRCSKLVINLGEPLFTATCYPVPIEEGDGTDECTVLQTVITCVVSPGRVRLPPDYLKNIGYEGALATLVASPILEGSRVLVVGLEIWAAGEYDVLFGKDALTENAILFLRYATHYEFPDWSACQLPVGWSVEGLVQERLSFATFDEYREMVGDEVYAVEICP